MKSKEELARELLECSHCNPMLYDLAKELAQRVLEDDWVRVEDELPPYDMTVEVEIIGDKTKTPPPRRISLADRVATDYRGEIWREINDDLDGLLDVRRWKHITPPNN